MLSETGWQDYPRDEAKYKIDGSESAFHWDRFELAAIATLAAVAAAANTDYFTHTSEGPDDSTSHIRMVLTRSSDVIPNADGRLQLGTWQGIFLFEQSPPPISGA